MGRMNILIALGIPILTIPFGKLKMVEFHGRLNTIFRMQLSI